MSFRDDILDVIEDRRSLPGELDIRQFRVFVVVRLWTGDRPGVGDSDDTETELLVSGYPPKVKPVTSKDAIASGGLYTAADLRVGPMTPPNTNGGIAPGVHNPVTDPNPQEILFRVEGPGLPDGGAWFKRVGDETYGNFSHYLVLRQTGVTNL